MDSNKGRHQRSGSFSGTAKSSEAIRCYGVSQGFYTVKIGVAVGTSSLGSCFALIAAKGPKVVFAHVQAGTTLQSLIDIVQNNLPGVSNVFIVRGVSSSEGTEKLITLLSSTFKVELVTSQTSAVVYDPLSRELSKPSDIEATNSSTYKPSNSEGRVLDVDEPIKEMPR